MYTQPFIRGIICLLLQGLEEAEQQLQREKTELDGLEMFQSRVESNKTRRDDSEDSRGGHRGRPSVSAAAGLQDDNHPPGGALQV